MKNSSYNRNVIRSDIKTKTRKENTPNVGFKKRLLIRSKHSTGEGYRSCEAGSGDVKGLMGHVILHYHGILLLLYIL